jgi:integrase
MADYHLFTETVAGKNGKPCQRWHYWFYDTEGKQRKRRCKGCRTKAEAAAYIEQLPPLHIPEEKSLALVRDIAKDMFIPGGSHMERITQLGRDLSAESIREMRLYIGKIIQDWGDVPLSALEPDDVVDFLVKKDRSYSWKTRYLAMFEEIYREAPRHGCKIPAQKFPKFAKNSKKANALTTDELNKLLKPENFPDIRFYLFFLVCLSAGLRLGEVRAVRVRQILFDRKVLVVDGFCKRNGDRTNYNKKGSPDDPKFRVAFLPDFTLEKLKAYIAEKGISGDDFCFLKNDKPIRKEYAESVFYRALLASGIIPPALPDPENKNDIPRKKQRPKPPDGRRDETIAGFAGAEQTAGKLFA